MQNARWFVTMSYRLRAGMASEMPPGGAMAGGSVRLRRALSSSGFGAGGGLYRPRSLARSRLGQYRLAAGV